MYTFSSVQSLSHVRLFATPWTAGRQASLSITNSRSLRKLMSIELVYTHTRTCVHTHTHTHIYICLLCKLMSIESVYTHTHTHTHTYICLSVCLSPASVFLGSSVVKNLSANVGDVSLIPGLERSPGEGNGEPFQYSCLGKAMDRGAWWITVHGVTKSRTQLSD